MSFETTSGLVFYRGRTTTRSKTWSADIQNQIIGLRSQSVKNTETGEEELNSVTILVNLCSHQGSSPVVDEYLAKRYYGDYKTSTILKLRNERDFDNFPERNSVTKWPEIVTDTVLMEPKPEP